MLIFFFSPGSRKSWSTDRRCQKEPKLSQFPPWNSPISPVLTGTRLSIRKLSRKRRRNGSSTLLGKARYALIESKALSLMVPYIRYVYSTSMSSSLWRLSLTTTSPSWTMQLHPMQLQWGSMSWSTGAEQAAARKLQSLRLPGKYSRLPGITRISF